MYKAAVSESKQFEGLTFAKQSDEGFQLRKHFKQFSCEELRLRDKAGQSCIPAFANSKDSPFHSRYCDFLVQITA